MTKTTNNDYRFILALLFALWFAAAGIFWIYWAALYAAYPFGLAAFLLWKRIRADGRQRNRIIPVILIIGLVGSLGMLAWIYLQRSIVP